MYTTFQDWVYRNEEKLKSAFSLLLLALNSAGLYFALMLGGILPQALDYMPPGAMRYYYFFLLITSLANLLYVAVFFISKYYKIKQ